MPTNNKPLDASAAIPLYQQVMDLIKNDIDTGTYASGSKIPTEFELADAYQVGRITVRRAVEELVQEGYLTKQQGRGTFVNAPKLKRKIRQCGEVQSFSDACAVDGMAAGARVLARRVVKATSADAVFFGVGEGAELIVVERIRTADGVPIMYESNTFLLCDHDYLREADLSDNSIFKLVADTTGRVPTTSEPCTLEICRADVETARALKVPAGEPLCYMEAFFQDQNRRPLIIGRQRIVGSRYVFDI